MSKKKKQKNKLDLLEIYNSIRKVWEINPRTRVKQNKKKKNNRAKVKQELKRKTR